MSGKNAAGQKIHRIGITDLLVMSCHLLIIDILPKRSGINASVLSQAQGRLYGMHIMNGE